MGKRVFQSPVWTPAPTADAGTTLANSNYMGIGAINNTSGLLVQEIEIGGQSGSSAALIMMFARHGVVAASAAALVAPNSDGPMNTYGQQAATGTLAFIAATTPPQRSNNISSGRLNLTFNAFGGIVRWQAAPFEEWGIIGNVVNTTESSLSAFTGSGTSAIGAHIIYEAFNS